MRVELSHTKLSYFGINVIQPIMYAFKEIKPLSTSLFFQPPSLHFFNRSFTVRSSFQLDSFHDIIIEIAIILYHIFSDLTSTFIQPMSCQYAFPITFFCFSIPRYILQPVHADWTLRCPCQQVARVPQVSLRALTRHASSRVNRVLTAVSLARVSSRFARSV